jgi:hypothetical protein
MYAAMGKNGQLINVVPSMNLVMLRIGDAPGDNGEVPISFNNEIWLYLNKVICNGSNFLSEPIEDVKVSIYPNPAQTSFEINGLLARDIMEIGVYDLQGKQQLSSTNSLEVDIYNLTPAFYFVKIITNRGILVKNIVKNL